jgi:hypothetical protein
VVEAEHSSQRSHLGSPSLGWDVVASAADDLLGRLASLAIHQEEVAQEAVRTSCWRDAGGSCG